MTPEQTITQYLATLGIPANPFQPLPGFTGVNGTMVSQMGLNVDVQVHQNQLLLVQILIGYVPQGNVAPLLRQLLSINAQLVGVYFCILDNNAILLRASRNVLGLDMAEFRTLIDAVASTTWQHAMNLINTFQIPSQPA
ncbi:MAG: YbjN domain-containing protein [Anaerolineae bacterium]|nr:YbjN domain-containing protein [Anaerolineae bacterium]